MPRCGVGDDTNTDYWRLLEMKKTVLFTDKAAAAGGPYSQAIRAGGFIFTAGQLGIVPGTHEFAGPDIESQTHQALNNIGAILEAAGSRLDNVIKCTVFLADMQDFSRMNEVYKGYFGEALPARSAVEVSALGLGACVEIEAIALAES
jgi:2-iminobutanoate/2-iminopropanoate deaminase